MQNLDSWIESLLEILEKNEILLSIFRQESSPDEPKMYRFSARVKTNIKITDNAGWEGGAGGFSFHSVKLALLKCLVEAAERASNASYRERSIFYTSFEKIRDKALDLSAYIDKLEAYKDNLGWVKGLDLLNSRRSYIPAQLVYLNYKTIKNEPFLGSTISTGAAGGVDYESTLLRGIYEIIERDAFMCVYLARIAIPEVDLVKLQSPKINRILDQAQRYDLDIKVFDITNDLGIPSFMSILVDKTGLGPSFSIGLKSSMSPEQAILGSIEESFHTRPWMRQVLINQNKTNLKYVMTAKIHTMLERGVFWLPPKMLKNLDFLNSHSKKKILFKKPFKNANEELEYIKKILINKRLATYCIDITPKLFKNSNFKALKVIIPNLQPLFLHEEHRKININRISTVASFFGVEKFKLNNLPHPFL